MRSALVLLALVASCEGRCEVRTAVRDEMPNGQCFVDEPRDEAVCLDDGKVIHCAVVGHAFSHRAICKPMGRLVATPEVP